MSRRGPRPHHLLFRKELFVPASLLGNLVYAGYITLLVSADTDLGGINKAMTLYSIAAGQVSAASPDSALFQVGTMQGTAAIGAGIGHGQMTLPVQLFTRTGSTAVWYNPNTTVQAGDISIQYYHSAIR